MQTRLVQNFTYIMELGQGTCTLTKRTRRWTCSALRHFCFFNGSEFRRKLICTIIRGQNWVLSQSYFGAMPFSPTPPTLNSEFWVSTLDFLCQLLVLQALQAMQHFTLVAFSFKCCLGFFCYAPNRSVSLFWVVWIVGVILNFEIFFIFATIFTSGVLFILG